MFSSLVLLAIHQDGKQNNYAFDNLLIEAGHIQNVQTIIQGTDDESTDERAGNTAFAACERGTPEDDSCDSIQLIAHAGRRLRTVQACSQDSAGDSTKASSQSIRKNLDSVNLNPGNIGNFFIPADRIGLTAKRRLLQDEEKDQEGDEHHDGRDRDFHDEALTEAGEERIIRKAGDRITIRIDERRAAIDGHGSERCNERSDLSVGNDDTIHSAEQDTDESREKDRELRIRPFGDHARHERGRQREDRADGEIDAAGQDDEGHTKGNERIDGDLTSQIFQVRRIDEAVIQSRDNDKEYNETNERPHFSHKIFNFFGIHAYSPPVANVIIRVCVASL